MWIYPDRIFSRWSPEDDEDDDKGSSSSSNDTGTLIAAFIFGEKIQNQDFQDAVVDALIHSFGTPGEREGWYPGATWVDRAYEGTPEGSPLRSLIVDLHVFLGSSKWLDGSTNVVFLNDLARRLLDKRETFNFWNSITPSASSCNYHRHGKGDECYSVKGTRMTDLPLKKHQDYMILRTHFAR